MAVRNNQIECPIQVQVREHASKAEAIFRGEAHARSQGHILKRSVREAAIEPHHFIIEICDRDSVCASVAEVTRVEPHAGACLALRAESYARLHGNVLKCPIALVAVEL